MKGFVFKEQSVAGEIVARRTPIHSALCRGTAPHNAVVSSCLRLMREAFGQAALEFCTAPFLQGPNHRSMRGLLLAFSSTHSCTAFLFFVDHGDLRYHAHKAFFSLLAEDQHLGFERRLPAPIYQSLALMENEINHPRTWKVEPDLLNRPLGPIPFNSIRGNIPLYSL